jgi:hypothetical protein
MFSIDFYSLLYQMQTYFFCCGFVFCVSAYCGIKHRAVLPETKQKNKQKQWKMGAVLILAENYNNTKSLNINIFKDLYCGADETRTRGLLRDRQAL